jgi:hypothetical protein
MARQSALRKVADPDAPPVAEEQVDDLDEAAEVIPYTYSVTSYGADYPVDSLVKRIAAGDIVVPKFGWTQAGTTGIVGFERAYVWPRPMADRFIESLLLGLPVPGIFLVKEQSGRLLVLDGHQRLYTLRAYYQGVIHDERYRLANVQERFEGKRYEDLDTEDRRRLDDSIIHATIVRQDEPTEDQSSIYVIFERLNTGGVSLQPQEIRVALYHGEFVGVLQALNDDAAWRQLLGGKSLRLKDMEMILRFFAFLYHAGDYRSPMKDFLNRYMATNRHLKKQSRRDLAKIFTDTSRTILEGIGPRAFRPQRSVNAAVVDSVMVGVAKRILAKGPVRSPAELRARFDQLMGDRYYVAAIETSTAQEANVGRRLAIAETAFADVP